MPSALRPLLVAGPPVGGALYREVVRRLGCGAGRGVTDPQAPDDGWRERGRALAAELRERPTVLVAHGLAVPAAVAAALEAPPVALVLCNGPITRLDPVTRALAGFAGGPGGAQLLARTLLRPEVWLRLLASSAALRRTVSNPYAMDRDTVALLCGPEVGTPAGRRATAAYLRSLATGLPDVRMLKCPVTLLWGDEDALYPASEADHACAQVPGAAWSRVGGGRFFFPEERPWLVADAVAQVMRGHAPGRLP